MNVTRAAWSSLAAIVVAAGVAASAAIGLPVDRGVPATRSYSAVPATPAADGPASAVAGPSAATPALTPDVVDAMTERAFAMASPSVVSIDNVGIDSGSGVIYDRAGDIITNAHVVAEQRALRVTLSGGQMLAARLVGVDRTDDLAVIHITPGAAVTLRAAHFAPPGTIRVARTVLAIGSPLGLRQSVTIGLISAVGRTVREPDGTSLRDAIQTSAPINPGDSGGALVTLDGMVIGIPTLEARDEQNNNGGVAQGIGFAVSSSQITRAASLLVTRDHSPVVSHR